MELARTTPIPLPAPKTPIAIRPAVLDDIPFMDGLQKLHTRQVGWMPTKQFEGKIKAGHVLIAEEVGNEPRTSVSGLSAEAETLPHGRGSLPNPLGYLIGNDQYFKRDDVGIIYQMNVVPGKQRGLIGATLLKAQFERSAYGCRLYCCWCAQDIAANQFWEAMGFVPLAFRTGSAKKSRTHIFWQKRIRSGDCETPWWFPSQTSGGSIREDRLVLPIPPGTHWSDAKPMILPGSDSNEPRPLGSVLPSQTKALPHDRGSLRGGIPNRKSKTDAPNKIAHRQFGPPSLKIEPEPIAKQPKPKQPKRKNDPKLIGAARELRDRWLEQVNAGQIAVSGGKYEITRAIDPVRIGRIEIQPMKLLPAA